MKYFFQDSDGSVYRSNYVAGPGKRLPKVEGEALFREQCRQRLLEQLEPRDTVYTLLRHVSRSGMSRRISLYIARDSEMHNLDFLAAQLVGRKEDGQGIACSGCGMDMGFELVYNLGRCLWPNGTPEPHSRRNGELDRDGGYALKQSWM